MPMVLSYAFCNVSVLPVRSEPYHTSEQVHQLLWGEKVEIQQSNSRDWVKIRCDWDGYQGWCKRSQLTLTQTKEHRKETKYISGNHYGKILLPDGEMSLPLGSMLNNLKEGKLKLANQEGKFKGLKHNIIQTVPSTDGLKNAALQYIYAPYQWGGRTNAGIDCSGLTQMAYKLNNVPLPRDASDQSTVGTLVDFLVHGKCGDLAFFEEKEGIINHVGMLLDNETIIHATDTAGRVVIDSIDQGGIISRLLKKRTHNLRMVRRILV